MVLGTLGKGAERPGQGQELGTEEEGTHSP